MLYTTVPCGSVESPTGKFELRNLKTSDIFYCKRKHVCLEKINNNNKNK